MVFIEDFGFARGRSRGFWGVEAVKQTAVRSINGLSGDSGLVGWLSGKL